MSKRNAKVAITAAVVLLALGGQARLAHAGAIAQSILDITDFTVTAPSNVTVTGFANSGSVLANLDGATAADVVIATPGDVALSVCLGPGCPHTAGTELNPPPTTTFASSIANLTGSAVVGGADAITDNTVSLLNAGEGLAASELGLVSTFTVEVTGGPATVGFSFDVLVDLLAHIEAGQAGTADAEVGWTLTIIGTGGAFVFAPNGVVGAGETADDCNQNTNVGVLGIGPLTAELECDGQFAASVVLAPGAYTVTISHSGSASAATLLLPEPGSLSLAALGLLAFGLGRRRFFKS